MCTNYTLKNNIIEMSGRISITFKNIKSHHSDIFINMDPQFFLY